MNFPISYTDKLRIPDSTEQKQSGITIAIDMGCEFTKVSQWDEEENCSSLIRIDNADSIPTAIAYDNRDSFVIGEEAIHKLLVSPKQVIQHFPCLLGKELNETVIDELKSFGVVEFASNDENRSIWHILTNETNIKLSLLDVYIDFLTVLITKIEESIQQSISTIFFITHSPSSSVTTFLKSISTQLHLSIEPILASTSMCLSYGFYDDNTKKHLLLLDFGWDNVRIQLVENDNNVYKYGPFLECTELAGKRIFTSLQNAIMNQFNESNQAILQSNYLFCNKVNLNIYSCLNRTKKLLDLQKTDKIQRMDTFTANLSISSHMFKKVILQAIASFNTRLHQFFTENSIQPEAFDDILVSGGVANCNYVYEYLETTFPNTYFPDLFSIYNPTNNANEDVQVNGAAIQCASWKGHSMKELQSLLYIDLLPHDICVQTEAGFEVVIPKGSTIPTRKTIEVCLQDEDQESLSLEVYRREKQDEDEFIKLGEFEFNLNKDEIEDPSSVGVTFTIMENGKISAECTGSYEPDVNMTNIVILVIALIILVIAYVFLKLYFRDTRLQLGENRYLF